MRKDQVTDNDAFMLAKIVTIYALSVCKILLPEKWVVYIFGQIPSLHRLNPIELPHNHHLIKASHVFSAYECCCLNEDLQSHWSHLYLIPSCLDCLCFSRISLQSWSQSDRIPSCLDCWGNFSKLMNVALLSQWSELYISSSFFYCLCNLTC